MANARKADDSEQQRLTAAIEHFAAQAQKLPSVAAVVVVPGPERDLSTYIDDRDEEVTERLMDIEDELFAMFDDELFDFHVWYLSGRPVEEVLPANVQVIYRRA